MADGNASLNPVDPDVNIIPNPGDYVFQFNRYYLAINPNPAQGPITWRISDPDEFPCDGGVILPPDLDFMVVAEAPMVVEGDENGIHYSFSMEGVPFENAGGAQAITSVENLQEPILLTNFENDPVFSIYDNNDKATVTSFNIYELKHEQYSTTRNSRTMRATVYNSNRSIPVTGSDPVQTALDVASTDLFFDISSLSLAA